MQMRDVNRTRTQKVGLFESVSCVGFFTFVWDKGVGRTTPLLGNISVRAALLHHHPAFTYTHTHTLHQHPLSAHQSQRRTCGLSILNKAL